MYIGSFLKRGGSPKLDCDTQLCACEYVVYDAICEFGWIVHNSKFRVIKVREITNG